MKFRVTLKKVVLAEVTVEAESAAELRRLLADDSDYAMDCWAQADGFTQTITVKALEKSL